MRSFAIFIGCLTPRRPPFAALRGAQDKLAAVSKGEGLKAILQ
jgi:hypothetical protein